MPRLRNKETGSIVNVDDATAERLGPVYEPVRDEQSKKATTKKSSSSKTDK